MRHHVLTVTSGAAWAAIVNILNSYFMLRWAAIFFIIAIVAAIFGFGGIAEGAASNRQNSLLCFCCVVCSRANLRLYFF